MANPVVHFELWSKDPQRTSDFYSRAFDWSIQSIPELKYWTADTGGEGINGGIMRPQDGSWPGNMCFYIKVPRLSDALARITKAGGKPIVERMEIPNMGAFALFEDPDGRVIGLWQIELPAAGSDGGRRSDGENGDAPSAPPDRAR